MSELLNSEMHREVIRMKLNRSRAVGDKLHGEDLTSPDECEIWGEGISRPVRLGDDARFIVRSPTPGLLYFSIDVLDPDLHAIDVGFQCLEENIHLVSFCPFKAGEYVMDVKWAGKPVMGSPITVRVNNED